MLKSIRFLLWIFVSIPFIVNASPSSKKSLLSIYAMHPVTFFSETPFNLKGKAKISLCAQCPSQEINIQWMMIVAPSYYLNNKMCYTTKLCIDGKGHRFGGIRCCRIKDTVFNQFENDLHQLVPELPALKTLVRKYTSDSIEPNAKLKGTIGRIFLYMNLKYRLGLSRSEKIRYETWHRQNPALEWEKNRNKLIKNIQGDGNPYIE